MIRTIPLGKLVPSPRNVRRGIDEQADLELKADIAARGLLQNLVVTQAKRPRGCFAVEAGERRRRALQSLADDGALAADHEVACLVVDSVADGHEASLAENFQRLAMNPADECLAFQALIEQGADVAGVARRFGLTERFVEGRLRLAGLARQVFEALGAGEISLDVAKAFAATPDRERQAWVYEQLAGYSGFYPDSVRRMMTQATASGADRRARLVGEEAYLPAAQRKVVTPNNDTIYGACFADLGEEPVVIQTPEDVPPGHYWTIQIVDAFTTVVHQLGSASHTPAGKYLWVGPGWTGEVPEGFKGVLHSPTNIGVAMARSFASRTPEGKATARAVLNQMGALPLSADKPGRHIFDCEASARNKVYPPNLTAEMLAKDPDLLRNRPVHGSTFWDDLERALDANPKVGADDAPMAEQARTLLALRKSDPRWGALLDRAALTGDAELYEGARYDQVGVDAGNGWQRQENGGAWGTDWYGRALAAVIYIYVNDFHEAVYLIRGTDAEGALLQGRYRYTMRFQKGQLPPVDRATGGFWSLTMYDRDYFMTPTSPNGRHNIGTVNLDANELVFGDDGSLTLVLSHEEPGDAQGKANWLPAPNDQFALLLRAYVPTEAILSGSYQLPDVERVR